MTRDEISVHEAGHCCCALLLGRSYGAAVFGEHGEGGGLASPGDLDTPAKCTDYTPDILDGCFVGNDLADVLTDAAITAGGVVAVAIRTGADRRFVYLRGPDREIVDAGARAVLGDDADLQEIKAFHGLAIARAWRMLARNWFRVEAVAAVLSERGRLSAADVAAAMFPEAVPRDTPSPQADSKA